MIDIKIDDLEISVKPNISILEACKLIGIHIPRFVIMSFYQFLETVECV